MLMSKTVKYDNYDISITWNKTEGKNTKSYLLK